MKRARSARAARRGPGSAHSSAPLVSGGSDEGGGGGGVGVGVGVERQQGEGASPLGADDKPRTASPPRRKRGRQPAVSPARRPPAAAPARSLPPPPKMARGALPPGRCPPTGGAGSRSGEGSPYDWDDDDDDVDEDDDDDELSFNEDSYGEFDDDDDDDDEEEDDIPLSRLAAAPGRADCAAPTMASRRRRQRGSPGGAQTRVYPVQGQKEKSDKPSAVEKGTVGDEIIVIDGDERDTVSVGTDVKRNDSKGDAARKVRPRRRQPQSTAAAPNRLGNAGAARVAPAVAADCPPPSKVEGEEPPPVRPWGGLPESAPPAGAGRGGGGGGRCAEEKKEVADVVIPSVPRLAAPSPSSSAEANAKAAVVKLSDPLDATPRPDAAPPPPERRKRKLNGSACVDVEAASPLRPVCERVRKVTMGADPSQGGASEPLQGGGATVSPKNDGGASGCASTDFVSVYGAAAPPLVGSVGPAHHMGPLPGVPVAGGVAAAPALLLAPALAQETEKTTPPPAPTSRLRTVPMEKLKPQGGGRGGEPNGSALGHRSTGITPVPAAAAAAVAPVSSIKDIKVGLFLEGMRVHRGGGAERRFADYWDALGRYLSVGGGTGVAGPVGGRMRSNVDGDSNGVEAQLRSFLKTKRLRRLHNEAIFAIMRQSLQGEVPAAEFRQHVPLQWKGYVRIRPPSVRVTPRPPQSSKVPDHSLKRRRQDKDDVERLRYDFRCDSALWTARGPRHVGVAPSPPHAAPSTPSQSAKAPTAAPGAPLFPPANLPGALTVDPTVRALVSRASMSVSDDAVWLLVVAVREHMRKVLRRAVAEADVGAAASSPADGSGGLVFARTAPPPSPAVAGGGDEQRRSLLTVFDVARALAGNPRLGGGGHAIVPASRLAWERCVVAANGGAAISAAPPPPPEGLESARGGINRAIEVAAVAASAPHKRARSSRARSSGAAPAKSTGGANVSNPSPPARAKPGRTPAVDPANPRPAAAVAASSVPQATAEAMKKGGTGKDLSTMKKRTSSSPPAAGAGLVAAATHDRQNGESDARSATSSQSSPPPNASASPPRRGMGRGARGFGAKNLAAMRARRQGSSGPSDGEPSSQQTKDEQVTAVEPVKLD